MDKLDMFNSIRMLDIYTYICMCQYTKYIFAQDIQTQILWKWNEQISFSLTQLAIRKLFSMRTAVLSRVCLRICLSICLFVFLSFSFTPSLCLSVFLAVYVMSLRVWSDVRVCLSSMRSPSPLASVCISIE